MTQTMTGGIIVGCLVVAFLMTLDRRELAYAALACVIGGVLAYGQPSEAVGMEPAGHSAGNDHYVRKEWTMVDLQDARACVHQLACAKRELGEAVAADALDCVLAALEQERGRASFLLRVAEAAEDLDQSRGRARAAAHDRMRVWLDEWRAFEQSITR